MFRSKLECWPVRKFKFKKTFAPLTASIMFLFATTASAQFEPEPGIGGNNQPNIPNVELEKRQGAEHRLEAFGTDLLGDGIDPHTGSLSFTTTDVSIPGNFSLPVMIERSRKQGLHYDKSVSVEFGDWQLNVPRIHVLTKSTNNWTGNRCTNTTIQSFPSYSMGNTGTLWTAGDYTNGINMTLPGQGSKELLRPISSNNGTAFPSDTRFVSVDGWRYTCGSANDGGQGFIGHAPDGSEYRFDRFYTVQADNLGSKSKGASMPRNRNILAATQVTDIHGNTVNYTYDYLNRLTRIQSSDSRRIDLSYSGASKVVSSVTANPGTADARSWSYNYAAKTYPYHAGLRHTLPKSLTAVTQPDGLAWDYDLAEMSASPGLGDFCPQYGVGVTVTHPNGMHGVFFLQETKHRPALNRTEPDVDGCPIDSFSGGNGYNYRPQMVKTMSVSSKTLSGSDVPEREWEYTYESDMGAVNSSANDPTNYTIVTEPGGRSMKYYHYWTADPLGGKLAKKEYFHGSNLMKTETYEYDQETRLGSTTMSLDSYPWSGVAPTHTTKTVETQDGDTFTSELDYNTNRISADYSFSRPVSSRSYSNRWNSVAPRGVDVEYEHNKTNWILGLPKTIYEVPSSGSRREQYAYTYSPKGQKLTQTRYGQAFASYTYHTSGNSNGLVKTHSDALTPPRVTQALNWDRGRPIQIIRPDGKEISQTVDRNGWVKTQKDAKNYVTGFTRDDMGRVTLIDPHGSWNNTDIAYSFPSTGGAIQTITKGQGRTTITYDSMFRTKLERTQALDTGWSSYVNTAYNDLDQVVFKSQPSFNEFETKGVNTTYDGLGRVYDITENVAPFAKTKHRYYSGHAHRVYDPSNAFTQYWSYGYAGPGNKDYSHIYRYDGGWKQKTVLSKNAWGQLTQLRQFGTHDGVTKDVRQRFRYDSQQRLCSHYAPEHNTTKYEYDVAGQMIAYAKGQTSQACGSIANSAVRVEQNYDKLGRPTLTNFVNAGTPDITKTYDDNSNILKVLRGTGSHAVNWTYTYNNADLPTSEKLTLDGRNYDIQYGYDANGSLNNKRLPSSRNMFYFPDGLGRSTKVERQSSAFNQVYANNVTYHASGSVHQMQYGNGQNFSQILNDRLLPERLLSYKGGNKAIDQTFTYDARGLVTAIDDGAVPANDRAYSYDGLGYLKTASGPWGTGSYDYDSIGNLHSKQLGSRTVSLNYDSNNRVSQSIDSGTSGTRTIGYDVRGNVTTLGNLGMAYDHSDQPIAVTGTANGIGSANGTYLYDGNLKRVRSVINDGSETKTIYNIYDMSGQLVHIHKLSDNVKMDYIHGPTGTLARVANNNQPTYLHPDHLGSAQAGTKQDGTIDWRTQYTPFGEEIVSPAANDNLDGFTGHIKDKATGLNYMQARYYDPVIGRFLSVDPVTFLETDDPRYFNRYAYTANNPINAIDPTGEWIWWVAKLGKGTVKRGPQISKKQAVKIRQQGGNVIADSRQAAGQVERAAASTPSDILRHKGHKLKDGSGKTGRPHFQNDNRNGHTFWSMIGGGLLVGLEAIFDEATLVSPMGCGTYACMGLEDPNISAELDSQSVVEDYDSVPSENTSQNDTKTDNADWGISGSVIYGSRGCGSRLNCD